MSFSYGPDPSNTRLDSIRFMVGDTEEVEHLLEDEEINWIIAEYSDERKQLAVAFRQCATMLAKKPDRRKLGPQEESAKDRLSYFREQADKYEHELNFSVTPPSPAYASTLMFSKGMMGNV